MATKKGGIEQGGKALSVAILILIFADLALSAQEQKIVTCTYSESANSVKCVRSYTAGWANEVIFRLGDLDLTEWRLTAPLQGESVNSDAPLFETPLKDGQKVKAIIDGYKLVPVASCPVRVWRKLKDYTSSHPGDRVPFGLRTEPDDCQPWYGKQ